MRRPRTARPARRLLVPRLLVPATVGCLLASVVGSTGAAAAAGPSTAYRAHDYADGQAMSILPPGENGLVNAADAVAAQGGVRPAGSQDQLSKYADLLYGSATLTDAGLTTYFD